jgi:Membrane dipeptidase (Peptidase family M19)
MIVDEGYDLADAHDYGQVGVPRMRRGRATGVFLAIWTDAVAYTPAQSIQRALDQIDAVRGNIARHPTEMVLAKTADEVMAAASVGR